MFEKKLLLLTSLLGRRNLKHSSFSTVRPAVHTNPSRTRSTAFRERSSNLEGIWKRLLSVLEKTENNLRAGPWVVDYRNSEPYVSFVFSFFSQLVPLKTLLKQIQIFATTWKKKNSSDENLLLIRPKKNLSKKVCMSGLWERNWYKTFQTHQDTSVRRMRWL